jgi:hypothetical protein
MQKGSWLYIRRLGPSYRDGLRAEITNKGIIRLGDPIPEGTE